MNRIFLMAIFLMMSNIAHSNQSVIFFEPGFHLEKRSAAELSTEWWKWAMSFSAQSEENPVNDTSGIHCGVGQRGKVWFLAGGYGSSKIQRNCVIPAEKYVFFPIINMVYYPASENNGFTCEQAKTHAALNNETALDVFVELDGVPIKDPKRFRAKTKKCFNMFEHVPKAFKPYNAYPSATDGYWILLKPLPIGKHSVKFGGRYNSPDTPYGRMVQDIEYEILVK